MEFTKLPWETAYRKHKDGTYSQEVFDSKGETIATLAWHPVEVAPGEIATDREANAHLIASAPQMYQMLQDIRDGVVANQARIGYDRFEKLMKVIRAAEGK